MNTPNRKLSSTAGIAVVLVVLLALAIPVSAQQPGRINVLIGFAQKPGAAEQALVRAHGGRIKYTYHLVNAIAASLPSTAISALSRNPNVTAVEIDEAVHKIDAELDNSWGVKQIGGGTVHDSPLSLTGAGVKVAIIDTGVDYTHPDLGGCFVATPSGTPCKVAGGYDFVNADNDPMDDDGHGTHVAGTVAAKMDGLGVVGVAPGATLYALKVLNASGSGSFSDVIAAVQWATTNGINVTNNSYGSSGNPGTIVQQAFDNSAAVGVLHIAAAGNSGNCAGKNDSVGYPAKYASVVAVAATDKNNARACFSSTGTAVELAAPGVGINSTKLGGGYVVYSGTSMATPHVVGAAAIVIQALTSASLPANAASVRQRLTSTATDLGAAGRDTAYGYGLVNLVAAVGGLAPPPPTPAVQVVITTDKTSYVSGTDNTASVTATVTNESGTAITGLDGTPFMSSLNGVSTVLGFAGTTTPGTYTASLALPPGAGPYTLAVTATDTRPVSGTGSASFSIVNAQAPANVASVTSINYATSGGKNGDKDLNITVQVNNDQGAVVSGATVSISLSRNGTPIASGTATTGTYGTVTFKLNNAASGTYSTTVTSVTAPGLTWDGNTPPNLFSK